MKKLLIPGFLIVLLSTLLLSNISIFKVSATTNKMTEPGLESTTTLADLAAMQMPNINKYPSIVKPSGSIHFATVTGLTVISVGDGKVSLSWNAIKEPDVEGYNIAYRMTGSNGDNWASQFSKNNFCTINGLTNSAEYEFKINVSYQSNQTSSYSGLVRATPEFELATEKSYYVSVDGNDNNAGTISQPWRTIQKAADSMLPGDTVFIRKGAYAEKIQLQKSGSPNKYITFKAYPGEDVTIDGKTVDWGIDWGSLFSTNNKNYIKISGIKVINSKWAGIGIYPDPDKTLLNGSNHIIVENCYTYNTKGPGIWFAYGSDIIIDGNIVEQACNGGNQECISLICIDVFEIKNNKVFNSLNGVNGGEGIDVKDGCSNGKIYNNEVSKTVSMGIYIDAYSRHQYNIEVYGNIVHDCCQGIGIATENVGMLENILIFNNISYNNDWGFVIGDWGKGVNKMNNINFINNTTFKIRDGGIRIENKHATNITITHNNFKGPGSYIPVCLIRANLDEITIDSNNLYRIVEGHPTGTNCMII